jgi:hypothetical protein
MSNVLPLLSQSEIKLFESVRRAVNSLPDLSLGIDQGGKPVQLSAHILSQAFRAAYEIESAHGKYSKMHDHSWLVTPEKNIIDVHPIASWGGPVLYYGSLPGVHTLFSRLPSAAVEQKFEGIFQTAWFWDAVYVVESQLRRHKEEEGREHVPLHSC